MSVVWQRVWPRRSGEPGAGLVLEGVDTTGRVVAGTAAGAGEAVRERAADPRLPRLDRLPGRVLGHRFGKRAVLRHEGSFLKVATARATRTALERHRAVADALRGDTSAPDLVDVLGSEDTVLRLRAAEGVDLSSLLAAGHPVRCAVAGRRTGEAMTALAHATSADLPEHDVTAEADVLQRWVDDAVAFGFAPRGLPEVSRALVAGLRAGGPGALVPSHRDLHDGQVLLGGRVTFLDVDTAALADPALDAANLLAHLDLAAGRGHRAGARAVEEGLWQAWRAHDHPLLADLGRLDLLRRVARCRIVAVHAFRGLPAGVSAELLDPAGGSGGGTRPRR